MSEEAEETSPIGDAVFEPLWKPLTGSKEEQLKRIRPPTDYPSESEFEDLLEKNGCDNISMGKRGDLYHQLCMNKWRYWKDRKWVRIVDWRKYVLGLESAIDDATNA